jgi:hypothetical protein
MEILTFIFKTLIPGCPMILGFTASRDISNFLGDFTTEKMLTIMLDLSPAEPGCLKPWNGGHRPGNS